MLVRLNKNGYHVNKNGGIYKHGSKYPIQTKILVANEYLSASNDLTRIPNQTLIASKLGVSRYFVNYVGDELMIHGCISDDNKQSRGTDTIKGIPGHTKLGVLEYWFLLNLYREEPSRTLASYVHQLKNINGVEISILTVQRIFNEAFPFKGKLRSANISL